MQVGLFAGVTACFLAVGAHAEHCFDAEQRWFTTGGTGKAGYWEFTPSVGKMGPVAPLPITCFQQDVRFEMDGERFRFVPLGSETASAKKCALDVDQSSMVWVGGYDKSVSDWRIKVRAEMVPDPENPSAAKTAERAFIVKCTLEDAKTPVLRLSTSIIAGKAGDVKYVWRSND